MTDAMVDLWQAVIYQMVADASIVPKNKERKRIRDEAITWLNDDDCKHGLIIVCELAEVDYDGFCEKYKRLIGNKRVADKEKAEKSGISRRFRNIRKKT